ncbi:MAG: hypothetical protein ACFFCS_03655 [Candidatus Hodarchaeota archaeon]
MPHIILNAIYPTHKQSEVVAKIASVGDKYAKPDLIKILAMSVNTCLEGIKIQITYEAVDNKFLEALQLIRKAAYEYINIEGFEYKIEVWYSGAEANALAMGQ